MEPKDITSYIINGYFLQTVLGAMCALATPLAFGQDDCNHYRQKAQESREFARQERSKAKSMGNDGSSAGGISGTHIAAAQAYENAATQYETKARNCEAGSTYEAKPGVISNNKGQALRKMLDSFGRYVNNDSGQAAAENARREASHNSAMRAANARIEEYIRNKASGRDDLNAQIEAEMARQALNDQIAAEMAKSAKLCWDNSPIPTNGICPTLEFPTTGSSSTGPGISVIEFKAQP